MNEPPYFPQRDLKVERAIGRFIIAWGALEREIDGAIHDLLLTRLRTGVLVTANLAIRAKLDLVHALFEALRSDDESIWHPVSKEWEHRFDQLINMTAKVNAEARIPIVHSQPQALKLESGIRPIWLRTSARKGGLHGSGVTYSRAYLDERTETVVTLTREWADARDHWDRAVHAMRSADADDWLGQSPDFQDHLILQLQPIHGSQRASPKRTQRKKPSSRA